MEKGSPNKCGKIVEINTAVTKEERNKEIMMRNEGEEPVHVLIKRIFNKFLIN